MLTREAFAQLLRSEELALARAARRLCRGDEDRAQDLMQDALVRAYESFLAGRFREGLNVRAWLLRILTNLYINEYHRRQKWDASVDLETLTAGGETGPPETHAAASDVPGATLLAATLEECLETALRSLSDPLRLCVLLVDLEGLDYAEAAAALQVPVGTIRSRLSRARLQLHALLYEYARDRGIVK